MAASADKWQLQAVHQQFDVFESFTSMYNRVSANNSVLQYFVQGILEEHCLFSEGKKSSAYEIGSAMTKNVSKDTKSINYSFVVIVMNKNENDKLTKVPVFILFSGNERLFIDVTCTVYKTWRAFMANNDLPPCEFCFPVDGFYNFGGKLKIDFAVSPATNQAIARMPSHSGGILISGWNLATSFICAIPQTVFRCVKQLFSVAEQYLPLIHQGFDLIPHIQQACDKLRSGNWNIMDFFSFMVPKLYKLYVDNKQLISQAWNSVHNKLNAMCNWISRKLGRYYELASGASRYMFLAVTSRIDARMKGIELKAKHQISAMSSTSISIANARKINIDSELDPKTHEYDTAEKYFKNCKIESSFFYGNKGKNDDSLFNEEPLSQSTKDLLDISHKLADCLQKESLNELQDIFEDLSYTVADEYEKRITFYSESHEAARVSAGGKFDVNAFNKALGINGKPEIHYWEEIITNISNNHNVISKIVKIMTETKIKKDIFMMPLWKKHEDREEGLYKIIGVHGAGKFSAGTFLKCLKEKGNISLDEKDLLLNETDTLISIRSNKITIMVYQETDEEKTAEGMLFIRQHYN